MAFAQTTPPLECKQEVNATGTASLTLNGAKENAVKAWTKSVVLRYGELFAKFEQAAAGKTADLCGRSTLGLHRCEAKGKPCAPGGASNPQPGTATGTVGPRELQCLPSDSSNCVGVVKWVQTRLNDKIGANLRPDGAEGGQTERAIRRFKRGRNLPSADDPTINEALLAALD